MSRALWTAWLLCCLTRAVSAEVAEVVAIKVDPARVELSASAARYSLLVEGRTADGRVVDLTRQATFRSLAPKNVDVSPEGVVRGLADGQGAIEVTAAGRTEQVAVSVRNASAPRRFNFENDIVPILSRHGCNSSGCHGKAEGQNGFKLSVFGFDPPADYDALTKEGRGRRVFPAAAEQSLLLQKASGASPHGGGVRIARDSPEYATLRDWIAAGLPRGQDDDPKVVSIEITPRERTLAMAKAVGRISNPSAKGASSAGNSEAGLGISQQLRVVARYSDGRSEDVTPLAKFQTNNDALANASDAGLVTAGEVPGQVAIMASYLGAVDVFRAIVPRPEKLDDASYPAEHNFIDHLVYEQLRKLNILPSDVADDATYLRRAYLDVIGTLPTAAEARAFLADTRSDKRRRLVDELLRRPEYADYQALLWADLLRVDRQTLGHKQAYAYYRWIRDSFARNMPLDQFARELLTAEGPLAEVPAGNFFRVVQKPGEMASTWSQVFLGVRIACAECHHHPFDRWSQDDYFGMVGYFAQLKTKKSPLGDVLLASGSPTVTNPRTGKAVPPHALGVSGSDNSASLADRRPQLAAWLTGHSSHLAPRDDLLSRSERTTERPTLTSRDNPWFARNMANRTWARLMGRGLVEPVDDFRDTNPPSNPALLDALAKHLIENRYDLRELIRTIAASRSYQLSTTPNRTNQRDDQNYSRAALKRLPAEVLLDAVCQTTGIGEKFAGVPEGCRAIQLWDNRSPHYFLKTFGRPVRETACECERVTEATIGQVLHLLNSPQIHAKISHEAGSVARLVSGRVGRGASPTTGEADASGPTDAQLAEELYLTFFSRLPTADERKTAVEYLRAASSQRQGAEDLAWSMLNSLEFVFGH
jgi:hypothetical protein